MKCRVYQATKETEENVVYLYKIFFLAILWSLCNTPRYIACGAAVMWQNNDVNKIEFISGFKWKILLWSKRSYRTRSTGMRFATSVHNIIFFRVLDMAPRKMFSIHFLSCNFNFTIIFIDCAHVLYTHSYKMCKHEVYVYVCNICIWLWCGGEF